MCGIWGIYELHNQAVVDPDELRVMGQTLVHRGPDETGLFMRGPIGLGIHRLRVIDLVSGQQPIANEDQSLTVVFNGEIYNYQELRSELLAKGHRFRSRSDTEVIVHLFEEEGPACVTRLDGIFAIALWDAKRQRLFLARDHLGVKPLYYADDGTRLLFGSELKPLLAAPRAEAHLDPLAVGDYLSLGYIPGTRTAFRNIRQLPAGHYLLCDGAGVRTTRYWDLRFESRIHRSMDACEEELLSLTTEAVKRQMVSDVPLGAFLSGGVDSSVIVALLAQQMDRPLKTFSIGFREKGYDESPFARQVSRLFGTEHHEISCTPRDCAAFLPQLPYYADSLLADPSLVPTFLVSRVARRDVTVVLSGDGGDELFAGYPTYQADVLLRSYRRLPRWLRASLHAVVDALPPSSNKLSLSYVGKKFMAGAGNSPERAHYSWRTMFTEEEKARLLTEDFLRESNGADPFETFQRSFDEARRWREPLDRFQYVDLKTWLVDDILVKVDRMTMAHSLEARVPFLDRALVEFACSIPAAWRMRGLETKHLFKRMAARVLPPRLVYRKKSGFLPALSAWFHGDWKELLGDTLSDAALRRIGWIRADAVRRLLREHWGRKQDHTYKLWNLLILCWWHEAFVNPGSWRRSQDLQPALPAITAGPQ